MITALQNEVKRRGADATFRATPVGELAVAICTPGEISAATLTRVAGAVRQIASTTPAFAIQIGGVVGEPNPNQPRAAALTIEGDEGKLEALGKAILQAAMIVADHENGYKPRVEIGRLKQLTESGRTNLGRAIRMAGKPETPSFVVSSLDILIAHAGPTGPELRPFEKIPLASEGIVPPPVMG
ncbi:MAG: hypothetical protein ABUL72_04845 [Armatimonadota bacterium]